MSSKRLAAQIPPLDEAAGRRGPLLVTLVALLVFAFAAGCDSDAASDEGSGGPASGGRAGASAGAQPGAGGQPAPGSGGHVSGAGTGASEASGSAGAAPSAGTGGVTEAGGAAGTSGTSAGGTAAGATTGGSASGGSASGGSASGGSASGGGGASASGGSAGAPLSVHKEGEVILTKAGLTNVTFGGYMNGESFQDGIVSFAGYQYAAFWNSARHVVVTRRKLPSGPWTALEFTDYTNTESDAHNTISIGICPEDGTIHLAFDHHVSTLHYRKSVAGLATAPTDTNWVRASFSAVSSQLVANVNITELTYPRFVIEPGGKKMLFDARIGTSGSGDQYLWEYDGQSHTWSSLGRYLYGTGDSINGYPHGMSYGRGGTRLHLSWCWRATSDAATNYDLLYAYSDDNGRTWHGTSGEKIATTGSSFVTKSSPGIKAWTINQRRGLINTEHMTSDGAGRVHVLLSHMPDSAADDADFDRARTKSQYYHYLRSTTGTWVRTAMNLPAVASFRGKLAVAASDNVYAVLPDMRLAAASPATNYSTWTLLDASEAGRFFSDPVIDMTRLMDQDALSIYYPHKGSSDISVLDYTIR